MSTWTKPTPSGLHCPSLRFTSLPLSNCYPVYLSSLEVSHRRPVYAASCPFHLIPLFQPQCEKRPCWTQWVLSSTGPSFHLCFPPSLPSPAAFDLPPSSPIVPKEFCVTILRFSYPPGMCATASPATVLPSLLVSSGVFR